MATVQRANVILQISDEPDVIQKYKDKGYDLIDYMTGEILERAIPHEKDALQSLVMELQAQVQAKTEEISKLKREIKRLKKKNQSQSVD